jgi:hypothetical protein
MIDVTAINAALARATAAAQELSNVTGLHVSLTVVSPELPGEEIVLVPTELPGQAALFYFGEL